MMCHSCSCVMIVSAAAAAAAAAPQQQIMKAPSSSPSHHRFLTHRLMNAVQRNPWKSLAGAGVFASMAYYHYTKKEESSEKKLLELPFYKLKIVEQRQGKWQQQLSRSTNNNNAIVMPVDELVELIHQAAQDPNIVGLYGIFGNGHGFSTGGWAHAQEIRNALCVFQQSHRTHDGTDAAAPQKKKVCSAYANTFASPLPNGLQEYYLATAFGSIGLQTHGDLNIFGLYSTNTFFKDCLQKYGIQVDVFKHGLYKNFANQFTHNRYTQEHKTNVWNIVQQINKHVHETIFVSRQLNQKFQSSDTFWSMVHQAGSFPAETAKMIGFIDSTPCRVDSKSLLAGEDDHKTISIAEYAKLKQTQKRKQEKQWKLYQQLKSFAEQNAVMEQLLSMIGYQGPHYNIPESEFSPEKAKGLDETIAVLKIGGPITDKVAQKTEKALQKLFKQIKDKKIKALVLRVDSPGGAITACETIHQQLQALPIKTVVSFGNVSASGGYYISTHADRIFASPTTITGSIGVFMIRMNLSGLAKQFGITFDSVHTSDLSGSMDPFTPINPRMKENFSNSAERSYKQFKSLVGAGRKMTDDAVETVAQGRVWTGHQAKEIGLVDELGGLHRAIAYCQRSFTNSGHAQIISWPPQKTLWELLQTKDWDEEDLPSPSILLLAATDYFGISSPTTATNHQSTSSSSWALLDPSKLSAASSGMMLTIDENWAIRCLLQNKQEAFPDDVLASFPPSFWD